MKNLCLLLLLCFWGNLYSAAQSLYGLDPTFANNGIYLGDTGVYGHILVESDGKIIVTGREKRNGAYENVKRFNEDGTIDYGFADNGFFTLLQANGNPLAWFNSVCFQSNGNILLGGGGSDFVLVKLKPNGQIDSSFGNNGITTTAFSGNEIITSVTFQNDGKIIACGQGQGINDVIIVARYKSDGMLDSSFGINGIVVSNGNTWGLDDPTPNDVASMPDGRIVIGATARINALNDYAFTVIRLLPNGNLDTSLNHTGITYSNLNLPALSYCKVMRLQPDGRILLGGYADSIVILRFDTSGQLDNSFGSGGIEKIAPGDGRAMELLPDGKIIIAGIATAGMPTNPGVVMYRRQPNGTIDQSFGMNGKISSYDFNVFNGVALQMDGKILVCGNSIYNTSPSYPVTAIARFMPNATNLKERNLNNLIDIYPNPANNYIYINNRTNQNIQQLSLYSTDGKLLQTHTGSFINRLAIDGLADGIYCLHISFTNYITIIKNVIIQKK